MVTNLVILIKDIHEQVVIYTLWLVKHTREISNRIFVDVQYTLSTAIAILIITKRA